MKKAYKYILLFLNTLAVLTLLFAFLTPMINPEKFSFLTVWGLIMPYILIINLFFIAYWILKAKFYFIISLLTIIISWSTVKTSFHYHRSDNSPTEEASLKVMSYNVRVFDRYNWSQKKNTVSDMFHFIKDQKADIICFQEFGSSKRGQDGITETFILNSLKEFPYHYIHYTPVSQRKRHQQGLAIFSKYPISNKGTIGDINLRKGGAIYADVNIDSYAIRIVNTHFESIHLSNKYDIIEGIDSKNYKMRIKGVVKSYNEAAVQHSISAKKMVQLIDDTSLPIVVCADMNNTPVSFCYHQICKTLEDAFLSNKTGFGATYNGTYPFLRIDYIFYSKTLPNCSYERIKVNYSDHYPITATFKVD